MSPKTADFMVSCFCKTMRQVTKAKCYRVIGQNCLKPYNFITAMDGIGVESYMVFALYCLLPYNSVVAADLIEIDSYMVFALHHL